MEVNNESKKNRLIDLIVGILTSGMGSLFLYWYISDGTMLDIVNTLVTEYSQMAVVRVLAPMFLVCYYLIVLAKIAWKGYWTETKLPTRKQVMVISIGGVIITILYSFIVYLCTSADAFKFFQMVRDVNLEAALCISIFALLVITNLSSYYSAQLASKM